MGKIYKIRIDSEVYEVEIEEVIKEATHRVYREVKATEKVQPKENIKETAPKESEVIKEESKEEIIENNVEYVLAPLPGKILKVMVKPGDVIKKGSVLLTIEAMKMENEIFAGFDAKVADVYVNPGDKVETNKKLLKLVR
ncbi:biotin/lipoyl-containing protein [Caldisericum exile]|uniref:Na(+)-transporting decarboxylase biotin carrier protein n=1 Tax=Caldisericum exile (strain DSM 21853 / NBRC 104410 / AZM16c01) TaxID=511051 RepID=A0A7U6GEY4_CALEA|nr:biotin/lipoyl-containing protein [Caldisericum exile]BAL81165.1 Na(+)-transporting decarboxylase biotin carrier protein [Caldisericum exile AZM16c01]